MNYELAKKLKDVGFRVPVGASSLWQPSLSELIEACGEKFSNLRNDEGRWIATASGVSYGQTGSTPEEAVANLWLALNEKKV